MRVIYFIIFFIISSSISASDRQIIGYLPSWVNWEVDQIHGDKMTSIKLSFLEIKDGKVVLGRNSRKYSFEESLYKMLLLRSKYPHLKLIISVGGWGIDGFSDIAADPLKRKVFSQSIIEFLAKYDFDGVDIDWEFPVHGGWGTIKARENDKENFVYLVEELRNDMDILDQKTGKKHLISLAVGAGPWVTEGIDFKAMELYVDYFGIMSYNLASSNSEITRSHVNLYRGKAYWSIDDIVKKILDTGVSSKQIILGIAFYGRPQGNVESGTRNGLYQSFSGNGGRASASFAFIKENYLGRRNFKVFFDKKTQSTHLYSKKEKLFISYHDQKSIKALAKYVKKKKLNGVLLWEITQDDKERTLLKSVYKYIK